MDTTGIENDGQNPSSETLAAIRARAYQLFLQGGEQTGSDLNHWLQAEREILSLNTTAPAHVMGIEV